MNVAIKWLRRFWHRVGALGNRWPCWPQFREERILVKPQPSKVRRGRA
jgi:hypothetical protein